MKKALYLIGMRGAGKSTLGSLAAKALQADHLDLDHALEERFGMSILAFVEKNGINAFREEEYRFLQNIEQKIQTNTLENDTVFILGGGILEKEESRVLLQQSLMPKIYLQVPTQILWQRLKKNPERRKIGNLNSEEEFLRLFAQRQPHFKALANIVFASPEGLAEAVLGLENHCRKLWQQ